MRKALVFGAALSLICGTGFPSISSAQQDQQGQQNQGQQNQGPEFLTITDGSEKPMNPAYFPHWDHQNRLKDFTDKKGRTGCAICHHGKKDDGTQAEYADAKEPKSRKCSTCHNKNPDGISLDGKVAGSSPIQRAGHGRCQGCHVDKKSTKIPPAHLMACPTCHYLYRDKAAK